MNKLFFKNNRHKLFKQLNNNSIVVLFSGALIAKSADQDYPFEVNKNFYYLTGLNQEEVILVLIKDEEKYEEYLFIKENNPNLSKWIGEKLSKEEVYALSGIDKIFYLDNFEDVLFSFLNNSRRQSYNISQMYLDLERRNSAHFTSLAFAFQKKITNLYPELKITNIYETIISLRMIKEAYEIAKIKESIASTKKALEHVMLNLKSGLYEYQVQNLFESFIKNEANKKTSFDTISAKGLNATILHYTKNDAIVKDGELILLDLGAQTDFYISDISRTYPISGKFSQRQKEVYEAVLEVNQLCIAYLRPGLSWDEFNNYANMQLIKQLKKLKLITKDNELSNYYWHSIGHMIGLDTHDPVLRNQKFVPGMVLTVEPGLYIASEAIGVRIEDNVLITEDGAVNLSSDIIKRVNDIEEFMKK